MKTRVLTAVVLIPLVLAAVGCTNPWPLSVLLLGAATVCALEFAAFFGLKPWPVLIGPVSAAVGILASASWLPAAQSDRAPWAIGMTLVLALALFAAWNLARGRRAPLDLALGSMAFGVLFTGIMQIQRPHFSGAMSWSLPAPLLALLLPVWAGDTAAMLGGKAFGRRLLAPAISPKKTWEGAVANFVASVLVGWGVGAWLGFETWVGLACGASVGIFGQLGDLFESALKRAAGVKDSGSLLPGHGGLLDRIDAMLGSVLPVWLILHFSGSLP